MRIGQRYRITVTSWIAPNGKISAQTFVGTYLARGTVDGKPHIRILLDNGDKCVIPIEAIVCAQKA